MIGSWLSYPLNASTDGDMIKGAHASFHIAETQKSQR